jgi:carbamoyltransferase
VTLFGPAARPHEPIDLATDEGRRFADVAASVQRVLEEILVELARALQRETGSRICARRRRRAQRQAQRADPAPNRDSSESSCRPHRRRRLRARRRALCRPHPLRQCRSRSTRSPFLGPDLDAGNLCACARGRPAVAELAGEEFVATIADELAAGRIVGWMTGASEFGPRALGHRSILAAPQDAGRAIGLNRDIKYREEFRPFAPWCRPPMPTATSSCRRVRAAGPLHVGRIPGASRVARASRRA